MIKVLGNDCFKGNVKINVSLLFLGLFMIISNLSMSQVSGLNYYFEACREIKDKADGSCTKSEMKNFIQTKILKYVTSQMTAGKESIKLTMKIDTSGKVTYTVLSWLKDGKYGIQELNRNRIVLKGFRTKTDLFVTCEVPQNSAQVINDVYIRENMIFRLVEFMPVIDSCGSSSNMRYKDCVKNYFSNYFQQNIKYHPKDIEKNTNGKILLNLVIAPDGSVEDFGLYKPAPTPEAEQSIMQAFSAMISKELRFIPGFQLNNPVSVIIIFEVPFNAVK